MTLNESIKMCLNAFLEQTKDRPERAKAREMATLMMNDEEYLLEILALVSMLAIQIPGFPLQHSLEAMLGILENISKGQKG